MTCMHYKQYILTYVTYNDIAGRTCWYKGEIINRKVEIWLELEDNSSYNCWKFARCPYPGSTTYTRETEAEENQYAICS